MSYTPEELQVSASVLELAKILRTKAHANAKRASDLAWKDAEPMPYKNLSQDERLAEERAEYALRQKRENFDSDWASQHPVSEFVPAALAEIVDTAEQIRKIVRLSY